MSSNQPIATPRALPVRLRRMRNQGTGFVLALFVASQAAWPQSPEKPPDAQTLPKDLTNTSIEDLMNVEVTSVSKREQKLSRATSAVFVISQDEIQRSGATNIPDLLRMVPGLDVAQINGSNWAISSRGLNSEFANKLLVLIDGRTVYTPVFAGVHWDVQDVPLEDIARIEVIRGPGATVWGANAVNGVINIITKSAKETEGGLLSAGSGAHEPGFGVAQYGGALNPETSYRLFVKGFDHNSFPSLSGQNGHDGYDFLHGGFRVDSTLSKKDSLTVQGDLYEGSEGEIFHTVSLLPPFEAVVPGRADLSGGNVLGRWNHTFSPHSDTTLQIYFDKTARNNLVGGENVDTTDIDFQHHFQSGARQDFVWGLGYRYFAYSTQGSLAIAFLPAFAGHQLFSFFLQDEIALKPDRLYLTIGAKLEHNDFSGFEFQPSARIAWNVTTNRMLWAGYSRARRTPSPADRGLEIGFAAFPGRAGLPVLLTLQGNPKEASENLDAFEAGCRSQLRPNLSLDLATFYNRYGNLETVEPGTPAFELNPLPHLDIPAFFGNKMHGETHGIELAGNWKVTDRWTVSPGYALERIHLHTSSTSGDSRSVFKGEGNGPRHQAQIRSSVVLPRGFEWNTSVYFVGRLPAQQVPSYTRMDTGISWRAFHGFTLSLAGQNLLRDHHLEANSSNQSGLSGLIKRSAYVKFTWEF